MGTQGMGWVDLSGKDEREGFSEGVREAFQLHRIECNILPTLFFCQNGSMGKRCRRRFSFFAKVQSEYLTFSPFEECRRSHFEFSRGGSWLREKTRSVLFATT